jgi:hypothetical protein
LLRRGSLGEPHSVRSVVTSVSPSRGDDQARPPEPGMTLADLGDLLGPHEHALDLGGLVGAAHPALDTHVVRSGVGRAKSP